MSQWGDYVPNRMATMLRPRTHPRRWNLTVEERELIAQVRPGVYRPSEVVRGVASRPKLLPRLLRNMVRGASQGIRNDADLLNYLSQRRVARVVPDAATGAAWWGEQIFLDVLRPHLRPEMDALEIGAGAGRVARHVAPGVGQLLVTDVSGTMVDEARENLAHFTNVRCEQTHGFTLAGLEDASLDLVYAHDVFLLFDGNEALALLDECRRVLREDGLLAISLYTIDSVLWGQAQLSIARRLARAGHTSVLQIRPWTTAQMERLFEIVGFETLDLIRGTEPATADPEDYGPDRVGHWNAVLNEAAHCVFVARAVETPDPDC